LVPFSGWRRLVQRMLEEYGGCVAIDGYVIR